MLRTPRAYTLTPSLLASYAGTGVLCLAWVGVGRAYRLLAGGPRDWPGRRLNRPLDVRADLPSGANHAIGTIEETPPALVRVDISGPIEQRAGYHDQCGGWSDGHDAICERLCAAFETSDVLLVVDSPGGAAAGLQQAVERAQRAKAAQGRKVIGWPDEQAGSAAVWWMLGVCDEVYLPPAGQIGSIGARAAHTSIKGALDKEGVVVTYFSDPPEKVALAPERTIDEVGMERGTRDVRLAADAFRAAVCESEVGKRYGLTPEFLTKLGADMLTGDAAVKAGLADGVDTFENVVAYALALTERDENKTKERAA